jgi:hypothetical protein
MKIKRQIKAHFLLEKAHCNKWISKEILFNVICEEDYSLFERLRL